MEWTSGCICLLYLLLQSSVVKSDSGIFDDFYFSKQPDDIIVERGRPAMLHCLAKHISQDPEIKWIRDKEVINFELETRRHLLTNGTLYFEEVVHTRDERPDEGIYQCVATVPGLGTIVSRAAKVQVAYLLPFSSEPRNLILRVEDTAMFECNVDGLPDPEISWYKNNRPLLEDDDINLRVHRGGMLEISSIRYSDFANYKCQAKNAERLRMSETASLTRNPVPPSEGGQNPSFVIEPRDSTTRAGQTITLYCGANGRDHDGRPPSITWLKDGVTIDMSNLDSRFQLVGQGSLQIDRVEHTDSGIYTCRAANSDESIDAQAKVQVHVPPRFVTQPQNTAAQPNQDVELECEVAGFPRPTVRWMKNGDLIIPNDYFQLVDGHNLRILGLVTSDEGLYQCIASNQAGNIQAIAQLRIIQPAVPALSPPTSTPGVLATPTGGEATPTGGEAPPTGVLTTPTGASLAEDTELPSAPQQLRSIITSTRFVTLAWDVPSFTGPSEIITYSVYWKEDGSDRERLLNTSNQEVNIQHLKPASQYQFRVLAYNRYGPGRDLAVLNLTTKPEVDVPSAVRNIQVTVLSPTSIQVVWEPPENTHGAINKYKVYYYEQQDREETEMEVTVPSAVLADLRMFTDYSIRVVAFNSNGRGISTEEHVARTYSAVPSVAPQNVTLEPVSSSSIIVRWEPPSDGEANGIITGYKLRYKKAQRRDGSRSSKTITTDANIRFYALTDLDRATRYQIRIAAMNINGTGPATKWMTENTFMSDLDETAVPGQPSSLRVRPYSTAIVVSWTPPLDQNVKVRGYTLGYGIGLPDVYSQVLDSKRRIYTIESLKPSSEYVISLRAFNKVGDGRPIYETVITREESAPEPATPMTPPVGLRAIVLSPMTVLVRWTDTTLGRNQHINDNRFYIVRYGPRNTRKFRTVNATDLNAHINDLRPNTAYEFSVKVVKGRRKSGFSMSVFNTTLEAPPFSAPRDLTPERVDALPFGVTLNWQPPKLPNGQITGYLVFYTWDPSLDDREWAVQGTLGDQLSTTIRELQPDMKYYFKVQARNNKGFGPMSERIVYRTPPGTATNNGKSPNMLWIILASLAGLTLIAIVAILAFCLKRRQRPQNVNRGYKPSSKGGNFTPNENLKPPPDLWIHHDQLELKNINPDTPMTASPIPQDGKPINEDMPPEMANRRNSYINSSYDRRQSETRAMLEEETQRFRRPLRNTKPISFPIEQVTARDPIATAIIPNGHLADLAQPIPVRPVYPRTQYSTQYGSTGSRVPPTISDASSQPGSVYGYDPRSTSPYLKPISDGRASDYMTDDQTSCTSTYDGRSFKHRSRESLRSGGPQSPDSTYNSAPIPYDQLSNASSSGASTPLPDPNFCKSLPHQRSSHPLKSFTMPAPPSAPGTPANKAKPLMSSSPYKKSQPLKSKSPHPVISPRAPDVKKTKGEADDVTRSVSTEELSAEMKNLEGIMKDLTAITASKEFHC